MLPEDFIGVSKWKLDTPCLTVDLDILEKNIRTMEDHAASFGKKLRPHAKTHKCLRLARMQMDAGAVGICVAKVGEAEVLVQQRLKRGADHISGRFGLQGQEAHGLSRFGPGAHGRG